jgi:hypothetical protein
VKVCSMMTERSVSGLDGFFILYSFFFFFFLSVAFANLRTAKLIDSKCYLYLFIIFITQNACFVFYFMSDTMNFIYFYINI